MIVCHCTGATDREIRRNARLSGSAGEAGRRCGGCCAEVSRLVDLERGGQLPGQNATKSEGRAKDELGPARPRVA